MQCLVHTFYLCGHVLHCLRTDHRDKCLVEFDIIGTTEKSKIWLTVNNNEMYAWHICRDLMRSL